MANTNCSFTERDLLFTTTWERGSLNDLLRQHLIKQQIPYTTTFNGTVLFWDGNQLHKALFIVDSNNNVSAYRCVADKREYL